jgi:plasmid stabilization system protein ParE
MPAAPFRVAFTHLAEADLYEIEAYWIARGETWRGQKYFRDLTDTAERELSDPECARRGRPLPNTRHPKAWEILAFGIYRIIYRIDESDRRVDILRFWHSHRDDPRGEV